MLPALIVGALTAWYLGMRAGVIAAAVTFAALLAAAFIPGLTLAVYALVLAWSGALYFLGAKLSGKKPGGSVLGEMTGGVVGQVSSWAKKLMGKS